MRLLVVTAALLLAPQLCEAAATLRIDDQKSLTFSLGLKGTVTGSNNGASNHYDPTVDGAVLAVGGQYSPKLKAFMNGARAPTGAFNVLDAILAFEPYEVLKIWAGRMLVPTDRANLSGIFFGSSWDPSFLANGYPSAFLGRDDGATAWGVVGRLKYYLGAFRGRIGGSNRGNHLEYVGRLTFDLLAPEPAFYTNETYVGTKDVLALGVGGRYQPQGAGTVAAPSDFSGGNVDLLLEKRVGGAGVATFEAAYYLFDTGVAVDKQIQSGRGYYVTGGWLLPFFVGPGQPQLMLRAQHFAPTHGVAHDRYDGTLNYYVEGHFLRAALEGFDDRSAAGHVYGLRLGAQLIL